MRCHPSFTAYCLYQSNFCYLSLHGQRWVEGFSQGVTGRDRLQIPAHRVSLQVSTNYFITLHLKTFFFLQNTKVPSLAKKHPFRPFLNFQFLLSYWQRRFLTKSFCRSAENCFPLPKVFKGPFHPEALSVTRQLLERIFLTCIAGIAHLNRHYRTNCTALVHTMVAI